jgi:hypothetical protein
MSEYTITQEALVGSTRVIVDYTMDKGGPMEWRDALHFSILDWDSQTPELLEGEMHRRHDNWIKVITAPPAPAVELTPDELQAKITALITEQHAIKDQLLAITPDDQMIVLLEQQAVRIADELAVLQAGA